MKAPLDHLRSKKKPQRRTVWLGNSEIAEELSEAEGELSRLTTSLSAFTSQTKQDTGELVLQRIHELTVKVEEVTERVREIKERQKEDSVKFVFKAMNRKAADRLLEAHQPTDAQIADAKREGIDTINFNPDTYPMELILACMEQPNYDHDDPEQVQDVREWLESDSFNSGEFMSLYLAAVEVQQKRNVVEVGKD